MAGICLDHFTEAQNANFKIALSELTAGEKEAIGYDLINKNMKTS